MAKKIDIGVELDHIDSLTRANGEKAISELIWHALDANASEIHIDGYFGSNCAKHFGWLMPGISV